MRRIAWKRLLKTGPALAAGMLCSSIGMAVPLDIPNTPLFLRSLGVDPNLIMTLDDSASMMSAFLPEDWRVGSTATCSPSCISSGGFQVRYVGTNRFKSSDFNAMYYNPFVRYRLPTRPDQAATYYSTSFSAAKRNGFLASSSTLNLASQYRAQVDFTIEGGTDTTADVSGTQAYYYRWCASTDHPLTCPSSCDGTKDDEDCYIKIDVSATSGPSSEIGADERQNFANWYSFYRTRSLATVSAAMQAMGKVELGELRFGWQTLNCSEGGLNCCNTLPNSGTWNCKARNSTDPTTNFDNRIRNFDSGHQARFMNWLEHTAPPTPSIDTGTPLRTALARAGEYYRNNGVYSPYAEDPQVSTGTEYSCRRNFHLLMTDGIWNGALPSPSAGNFDGSSHTMPDGTSYTSRPPFADSQSDTLADFAAKYWGTDLRDGGSDNSGSCTGPTCNTLLPYKLDTATPLTLTTDAQIQDYIYWNPKNDPATWQHMTNFTVSLGLSAIMTNPAWGGSTFAGDYSALLAGTKPWPTLSLTTDDPLKVYDLWHTAINSRGKFFSADDPDSLAAAFEDILDTISAVSSPSGGAGLSADSTGVTTNTIGTLTASTLVFEATNNADWSGKLQARNINLTDYSLGSVVWDAGQRMPAAPARNIFTLNDSDSGETLTAASCSGALGTALDLDAAGASDGLCEQRINWLRGDARVQDAQCSGTGTLQITATNHGFLVDDAVTISGIITGASTSARYNGAFKVLSASTDTFDVSVAGGCETPTYAGGGRVRYTAFRDRNGNVLGDILGSDPVYVSNDDHGYGGYGGGSMVLNGSGSYSAYVAGKTTRPPMLYAGANDGMLHGFRADQGFADSGVEKLAYVPRGVYDNLSALTDPGYAHKFYVDGPIGVGDAYIGAAWGTYLAGSLGAGGKSVYALDISSPTTFTAADVLWEFSDANDLGLTYGKPQIAATTDSQWGVIFGNGYNSANEHAYFYVVDLANGNQLAKVATNTQDTNGLSAPYLHDSTGDKIIDVAYAGDLRGNLWKFVNSSGTWSLGNAGLPLFTANSGQAITSRPKVAAHPDGGLLVYFGTGSYLTDDDAASSDQQSFYAIWDNGVAGTVSRSDLQGQSIIQTTTFSGYSVRTTTDNLPNWSTQRGWYLDLTVDGSKPSERVLSTPLVLEFISASVPDRILFVTNTPTDDPCGSGGTTWLMELDLITGARTATSVFDFNGDYGFDDSDLMDTDGDGVGDTAVSGIALPTSYGMTGEPLVLETANPNRTQGGSLLIKEYSGTTGVSGPGGAPLQQGEGGGGRVQRIYWQQIQ
ncbi:pilus assembly protein [Thiocystis violacea]|uniref:pilus assembly protein n=1 Tax=Thiocystis violacea TaxID=13725 RepID=UPI0019068381|nr:PilC/PilY family type IV pilus protein [Thiocystis violacea]